MVGSFGRTLHRLALAGVVGVGALTALPRSGHTQFFFWDQPRYSADDVARLAMQHGFRPLTRPQRSDNVYLADVLDQRGRRERLVISADNGDVLQRFFLDEGRGYRRYADPSIPRGPVPPGTVPDDGNRDLLSRLTPGDDREFNREAVTPEGDDARPAARPPLRSRRSRAANQAPETIRQTPVESAPLSPAPPTPPPLRTPAPPTPAPAQAALPPAAPPVPAPAAASPPTAVAPPSDRPVRSISTDPLAIPGSREHDDAQATVKAPAPVSTGATAVKKLPPPAPAKPTVPVAPLE